MEEWKSLGFMGFPDYEVSSLGRVRSFKVRGNYRKNYKGEKQIYILKGSKQATSGYVEITLSQNGKKRQFQIHRLVALAFIPNPKKYKYVNHKDETRHNNKASNLEWCTCQYNVTYGTAVEKRVKAFKESLGIRYKATKGEEILYFRSLPDAAKKIGCSWGNIYYALTSKTHYSHGYYWEKVHKSNKGEPNG